MSKLLRPEERLSPEERRNLRRFIRNGTIIQQAIKTQELSRCPWCGIKSPLTKSVNEKAYKVTYSCGVCSYKRVFMWTEKKKETWKKFVMGDPSLNAFVMESPIAAHLEVQRKRLKRKNG